MLSYGSVRTVLCLLMVGGLMACDSSSNHAVNAQLPLTASCGSVDSPESALQGQVPKVDRGSGRSQQGYSCNLRLVGRYQGEGASWVNPSSAHCAYMATAFNGILIKESPGVQVIDVSDPQFPRLATNLIGPAMLNGPWESLKINEQRGLLAGVSGGPIDSAGLFDIYGIKDNCAYPQHLNNIPGSDLSLPADALGHEGAWSPDGNTYWATGVIAGAITAIDVSVPSTPKIIYTSAGAFPGGNHGLEISPDGMRMYLSVAGPSGVAILDISDIQNRSPYPQIRQLGRVEWESGNVQKPTLAYYKNHPYLFVTNEFDNQGIHVVDVKDEKNPQVIYQLQLEIQGEDYQGEREADLANNGFFGYEAHYCSVDSIQDPTALACGYFQSGVRVFDIRNPRAPREIAYFNPPAQVGQEWRLAGSEHAVGVGLAPSLSDSSADPLERIGGYLVDKTYQGGNSLTADWCSSPPRFVAPNQLWVTCQDNGFMVLEFTGGVYPR